MPRNETDRSIKMDMHLYTSVCSDTYALEELFRDLDHGFVHLPALLRGTDHKLLDLLKLVDAENAPHVTAVASGLFAEVGGVTSVPMRDEKR